MREWCTFTDKDGCVKYGRKTGHGLEFSSHWQRGYTRGLLLIVERYASSGRHCAQEPNHAVGVGQFSVAVVLLRPSAGRQRRAGQLYYKQGLP